MSSVNAVSVLLFCVIAGASWAASTVLGSSVLAAGVLVALLVAYSAKIADQWERAIILRLGRFSGVRGPGLFFIIPIIDSAAYWIDLRTITTTFTAEQTLTKDTVPVNVDAVLFWKVVNPQKAALEVENYAEAVNWSSQTALREIIGRTLLAEMLGNRDRLDADLKKVIDMRTEPWGIQVSSVEIRDVIIPQDLQDAMSRQAQAERERQARVILGESELQIAQKFKDAAKIYAGDPAALHLRAMNMLYEGLKEKGALVIVPSTAVETMGLGGIMGVASMAKEAQKKKQGADEKRS
ncbi:Stomatin [Candidatus Norongarragalina meridionalis]|nr:Stomatin [Candidatus Norongarragalina meridionalis]